MIKEIVHSPTPWRVVETDEQLLVVDANNSPVTLFGEIGRGNAQLVASAASVFEQNQRTIVALAMALEEVKTAILLERGLSDRLDGFAWDNTLGRIDAALAAAKGTK